MLIHILMYSLIWICCFHIIEISISKICLLFDIFSNIKCLYRHDVNFKGYAWSVIIHSTAFSFWVDFLAFSLYFQMYYSEYLDLFDFFPSWEYFLKWILRQGQTIQTFSKLQSKRQVAYFICYSVHWLCKYTVLCTSSEKKAICFSNL